MHMDHTLATIISSICGGAATITVFALAMYFRFYRRNKR